MRGERRVKHSTRAHATSRRELFGSAIAEGPGDFANGVYFFFSQRRCVLHIQIIFFQSCFCLLGSRCFVSFFQILFCMCWLIPSLSLSPTSPLSRLLSLACVLGVFVGVVSYRRAVYVQQRPPGFRGIEFGRLLCRGVRDLRRGGVHARELHVDLGGLLRYRNR